MQLFTKLQDVTAQRFSDTIHTFRLLTAQNGCTDGCSLGVTVFSSEEYNIPGTHDDQEGFFVLEGNGWAKVEEEEIRLEPGTAFLVPRGSHHSIKKDPGTHSVRVLWFHAFAQE